MNWLIKILMVHKRLRGLSEKELTDLIRTADDIEALKLIKEHLESGSFNYPHLEKKAPYLIQQCIDKAKEIHWQQQVNDVRDIFFNNLGDPFALIKKIDWFI